MKGAALTIIAVLLLSACNGTPTAEVPRQNDTNLAPSDGPPEDVMENIEMHLWQKSSAPRQGQKPLLSISARLFRGSVGSGDEWSFEGAEAFAPAQDEQGSDIEFMADSGVYVEDKRATLLGNVQANLNDMTIHLEDITWEIQPASGDTMGGGMAYTNQPVRIDSPTQQLNATSMTIDPATSAFTLKDVTGEIYFGGVAQ